MKKCVFCGDVIIQNFIPDDMGMVRKNIFIGLQVCQSYAMFGPIGLFGYQRSFFSGLMSVMCPDILM
jgi:hypothetical protein